MLTFAFLSLTPPGGMEKPDCDELLDLSLEDEDLFKSGLSSSPLFVMLQKEFRISFFLEIFL